MDSNDRVKEGPLTITNTERVPHEKYNLELLRFVGKNPREPSPPFSLSRSVSFLGAELASKDGFQMPQLDKLTYFSQFFWFFLFLFCFFILLFNNNNGILGISRILKLRNQLLSQRGNKIRSKDPKNLEDISRKGFSTGLSYMYSSFSEVSQWCKTVDYLGKRGKINLISDLSDLSGSRGIFQQIPYGISKCSYNTQITCWKNILLTHVPHGLGFLEL